MVKQAIKPNSNKKKIAKKYGVSLSTVYKAAAKERQKKEAKAQKQLSTAVVSTKVE